MDPEQKVGRNKPAPFRQALLRRLEGLACRNTQHWPQDFWNSPSGPYWAGGLVDCPYFDSPGVNAATTTEMLLQSYDGTIRVWPAVPDNWSGVFRLCAETGFLVVSERTGGQVRDVAIESLFGDTCRLVNPWNAPARVTHPGQVIAETDITDHRSPITDHRLDISFPTAKGKTYVVERLDCPILQFAFAPLAPTPNTDVKYLARPRRSSAPLASRPGLPMLGITRDGWTAPRAAAAANRTRAEEAIRAIVGNRPKIAGIRVQSLGPQNTLTVARWLSDGLYGRANIPWASNSAGYVVELPTPTSKCILVWSCDRTGQRQDSLSGVHEIAVSATKSKFTDAIWQENVGRNTECRPDSPQRVLRRAASVRYSNLLVYLHPSPEARDLSRKESSTCSIESLPTQRSSAESR